MSRMGARAASNNTAVSGLVEPKISMLLFGDVAFARYGNANREHEDTEAPYEGRVVNLTLYVTLTTVARKQM